MNFARLSTLAAAAALQTSLFGAAAAAVPDVRVVSDAGGQKLQVDGEDFMVFGMNWDYFPIGTNYTYSLWTQPDAVIEEALAREMPLLEAMGVNAIRQYADIPPRWVQHIYETYGIYTVVNHPCARYGFTVDGVWIANVDYGDPALREAVKNEVVALVEAYRDVPGVLMWLLGNENNYGLSWTTFETEAIPEDERDEARARQLYSMFGEVTDAIKQRDDRLVAVANGDVQYIDVIAEECRNLDVFGSNVYRGISARDLFEVVQAKLGVPVMFTEFGSDAFNSRDMREDQIMQCRYLLGQWEEIYEQSHGKGRVGNAIGGLIFQWTDGWWKYLQEERLDVHDTNASWPNGGYSDFVEGRNNMNEEWWGITAKGPTDASGLYEVFPRAAYYALRDAFRLDPYAEGTDLEVIREHFGEIHPAVAALQARGDHASLSTLAASKSGLTGLRLEFETFNTGGDRVSTPEDTGVEGAGFPAFQGFDHLQSFYADFTASPTPNVQGRLSLNVLGNVPLNPIDEIFYENRGRRTTLVTEGQTLEIDDLERIKVYEAGVYWDDSRFTLDGFYRTGHFHWGYEGDFFGLYREANYGENIDIYNGIAPVGFEMDGKGRFEGITLAMGPELWWGANPAVMGKVVRRVGPLNTAVVYQEDISSKSTVSSTFAIPEPRDRKATLYLSTTRGPAVLEAGGIWSGDPQVGEPFQIYEETDDGGFRLLQDEVKTLDTFGAKGKISVQKGRWNWYAQAAYMGLVADGGPTQTLTFTGWTLKDTGSGNQSSIMSGVAYNAGRLQIAPNVLYQKPLVGPVPGDVPSPGRPRNILDDPFAVRANREMFGAELLLTYDPTPATWMWMWDNDVREDSRLAGSLGIVYRDFKTTQDASIGILADGSTTFAFPGAPPPRRMWEVNTRVVSRLGARTRLVAHAYAGTGEPNGDDPRLIHRYGADARLVTGSLAFAGFAKLNDWGPYDYHRDFNLTFPAQLMGDISYSLGDPAWFDFKNTTLGVRGLFRTLDEHSPRYCPQTVPDPTGALVCDPLAPGDSGYEWEIRTYLHFAM